MAGLVNKAYGTVPCLEKPSDTRMGRGRNRSLRKAYSSVIVSLLASTVTFIYLTTWIAEIIPKWNNVHFEAPQTCPQFDAEKTTSRAQFEFETSIAAELQSNTFLNTSIQHLSGAVQIPTESFDDMGLVGDEPRWDIFEKFHEHLEHSFPLV